MKDVIIVGAGGFGREILVWMQPSFPADEFRLKGFLDSDEEKLDGFDVSAKIIGSPETYRPEENDRFLMAIGEPGAKRRCADSLLSRGAEFLTMIHPTALVAENARIGAGAVLYPFAGVSAKAIVGDFVHMNFYAAVGHDVTIGGCTTLSPYATVNGMASLGEDVFMGTHTSVAVGKTVGDRCKISSGAAVMHDVGDDKLVFGVPGRQTQLPG